MKGQWFIISAIFAAFAIFAVSSDLRSFRATDTSTVALYNENYHFASLKDGLQRTIQLSGNTCAELAENLNDYIYFSQLSKGRLGYSVNATYTIESCATKRVLFSIVQLKSDKLNIWQGNWTVG